LEVPPELGWLVEADAGAVVARGLLARVGAGTVTVGVSVGTGVAVTVAVAVGGTVFVAVGGGALKMASAVSSRCFS
jgi:hypothetical protein